MHPKMGIRPISVFIKTPTH